ncbi:MAG: NAD-dependent epimerase/dehydratase family protein [Oligoflexia bacterium]|nr:NAD-dependent epimerase/dehydratase family protein [Oligoflexia bacterium]MBF0367529.1 NAD-dependent epimerase/dehydratase family protein [Oligoflexia bacterium]
MVLVTGATGHLGNNLVRQLLSKGEGVRVLLRKNSNQSALEGLQVEKVYGDVLDYHSLLAVCKGIDCVYHCAALISLLPGEYKKLYATNVRGTENVIAACLEMRVNKLIQVSSVEAYGNANPGGVIDESYSFNPKRAMLAYGRTKAVGSLKVLEAVKSRGLHAVLICPVGIVGPYDFRPSSMGQMVIDFAHKSMPCYLGGGFDFVDVRDVAEATIVAAKKAPAGEAYLLTSEHLAILQLMDILQEITGIRRPYLKLPHAVAYLAALAAEKYYQFSKTTPVFTRDSINILQSHLRVNGEKAKRELSFAPREVRFALKDQYDFFKRAGKI